MVFAGPVGDQSDWGRPVHNDVETRAVFALWTEGGSLRVGGALGSGWDPDRSQEPLPWENHTHAAAWNGPISREHVSWL